MKKLLLSFIGLGLMLTLSAQNDRGITKRKCCGEKKFYKTDRVAHIPVDPVTLLSTKESKGTNIDTVICYDWSVFTASWVVSIMEVSMYDTFGITEFVRFTWNGSVWTNNVKESYIYDVNGFLTEFINYYWSGGVWTNMNKTTYINSGGPVTEALKQDWNGTAWVNNTKWEYSYDGLMNLTEVIEHMWTWNNNWELAYKFLYTYDIYFQLIENLQLAWNGNSWEDDLKITYFWDINGNMTEEIWTWWNGTWENSDRYTYTYDVNNFLVEQILAYWDMSGWLEYLKDTFTYGVDGLLDEVVTYQWELATWEYFQKCIFKHYDSSAGIDDDLLFSDDISIYPNPARDVINISSPFTVNIQIINTQGQILYTNELNGETKIDISFFPEGLYFIRSTSDGNSRIDKIIKH